MLARYGAPTRAIDALPEIARRMGGKAPSEAVSTAAAEDEIAAGAAAGAQLLRYGGPDYPERLAELHAPPPVLWVLGDPASVAPTAPAQPAAIVGARNATANGARFAEFLGRDLAAAGWPVVSGLARGVDAAAHLGALHGGGATAAVVAGGVDNVYPLENAALRERILAEGGAVFSEMPMGLTPQARHFPRRNRIVSGLAVGVVVIEAGARSGSLITARAALEQNREVAAAPGHPLDPRAAGANALIREGATLIRHAEDVIEAFERRYDAPRPTPPQGALFDPDADAAAPPDLAGRILAMLGAEATPIDEIARALDAPVSEVSAALLELEIAGAAETRPGGGASRVLAP